MAIIMWNLIKIRVALLFYKEILIIIYYNYNNIVTIK